MTTLNISLVIANEMIQNITSDLIMTETFISKDTDTLNLHSNISAYKALIETLQLQANTSFEVILLNQKNAIELKAMVDSLMQSIDTKEQLIEALNDSNTSIEIAKMSIFLGENISAVSSSLEQLEHGVDEFFEEFLIEIVDMDELVIKLEILDQTLDSFNSQLKSLTMISEVFENSALEVKEQADNVFRNVEIIKVCSVLCISVCIE